MADNVQHSVLCVQPDHDRHAALRSALSRHCVQIATCALDAVRLHNAQRFDAYVLDYWLPDWSGLGLCRQIRRTEPHAPICFFTAASTEEAVKRVQRAGANRLVHVSDGASVLASRIDALLEAAEMSSLRAKLEEERVISEELARQAALAARRALNARRDASRALERSAYARAVKAFVEAGGSLAKFERWWEPLYGAAMANHRLGDAEAGSE